MFNGNLFWILMDWIVDNLFLIKFFFVKFLKLNYVIKIFELFFLNCFYVFDMLWGKLKGNKDKGVMCFGVGGGLLSLDLRKRKRRVES